MIGIDIVVISRIEKLMEKFGEKALDRFLDEDEKKLIKSPATAAGFWAAKEAASKAIGTGIGSHCGFHDISILKDSRNAPKIKYKKSIRKKYKIKTSSLSITHDGGFAIAVVALEKK